MENVHTLEKSISVIYILSINMQKKPCNLARIRIYKDPVNQSTVWISGHVTWGYRGLQSNLLPCGLPFIPYRQYINLWKPELNFQKKNIFRHVDF